MNPRLLVVCDGGHREGKKTAMALATLMANLERCSGDEEKTVTLEFVKPPAPAEMFVKPQRKPKYKPPRWPRAK